MLRFVSLTIIVIIVFASSNVLAIGVSTPQTDASAKGQASHLILMLVFASVALLFSFLCSVAEAVVLSISPSFIANLKQQGSRGAALVDKTKTDIDRTLAAILTLNTIAHTVGAGGAGAEAAAYFGQQYVGAAMAILTLLILFLSEIIPKTIGAVYWRTLAIPTGHFVWGLTWILYPLIYLSELLTGLFTKGQSIHRISRDEFTALADLGAEHGHIDPEESRILKNLFRFPSLRATDIMTPRTVVFALQQDLTVHETLEKPSEIGFSRIPIFGENRDDVTGFVLKTDLLLSKSQSDGKARLRDIKRKLCAVKGDTSLSQLLERMLDQRDHILLVVDDYGGMEGVVTLEDVVETLIGIEIVDEADKDIDMRILARRKWEERMAQIGVDVQSSTDESPG